MKKIALGLNVMLVVLSACAPSSKITGSWKNEKHSDKRYKTVFVAVLTGNTIAKSLIENDFENAFTSYSISATKSIDEFPPKFEKDSIPKDEIMSKVKQKGSEAILTISILKHSTESRYTSGVYSPSMRFGYYGNFWGYYSYWYPYVYGPDYYVNEDTYYMETNLYDINSQELIWSAQSQTYDMDHLKSFSKEFAKSAVAKLREEGLLNTRISDKDNVEKLSHNK